MAHADREFTGGRSKKGGKTKSEGAIIKDATRTFNSRKSSDTKTKKNVSKARRGGKKGGAF